MGGFGASGAWWSLEIGAWPAATRGAILDLLFGPDGARLTIYRHNVGASAAAPAGEKVDPWRWPLSVETAPGAVDVARDAAALQVLRDVRARGVEEFVLFANSPPHDLTANGLTSGGDAGGPNLPEANEAAFAERFVGICVRLAETFDLPRVTLSPINEPDVTWGKDRRGQEGCFYPPEQTARVLALVAGEMDKRGLSPDRYGLEGPEVTSWASRAYFDALLKRRAEDAPLRRYLRRLVTHSYGGNDQDRRELRAMVARTAPGLAVAMSEWTQMRGGRDGGMASALVLAETVTRDLTLGDAVSWQAWIAVSKYDYHDGLIYAEPEPRTFTATKRLWALAQWSRFVPPGSVRLSAELDHAGALVASAFRRPDGAFACVVVNRGDAPMPLIVTGANEVRWRAAVTDADRDVAPLDVSGGVTLPPRSVTTLFGAAE